MKLPDFPQCRFLYADGWQWRMIFGWYFDLVDVDRCVRLEMQACESAPAAQERELLMRRGMRIPPVSDVECSDHKDICDYTV